MPCVAMGIPTIVMCDNIDRRFSWLDKVIPLYDKSCYDRVDWHPESVDIEDIKKEIIDLFRIRLEEYKGKYAKVDTVSGFWENRERFRYDGELEKLMQTLYGRFGDNGKFNYIIWGGGAHGHGCVRRRGNLRR